MKKALIITAFIAASASAYIFTQKSSASTYDALDYIRADTAIFAAQLKPFPLKDYITSYPTMVDPSEQEAISQLYDPKNPSANFVLSLMESYQASLNDADLFIKTFGLPAEVRAYAYTLGLLPVFRIEVENEQAIWTLLDEKEKETGYMHKKGTLNGVQYRAYAISNETAPIKAEVIVAINNGLLTVTFNSAHIDDALLATALGLTKVENSLADSSTLSDIIKKYNFKDSSVAFIDHVEIVKGITTQDGNLLAKQISQFDKKLADQNPFSSIRNKQCAMELGTIANNWPRTVSGYTEVDISAKESTVAVSTIIESQNNTILSALSALRGFVPSYTSDIKSSVLAMGLGLDVNNLASTLNTIWSDLQTPSYSCQPLAEIQTAIKQSGNSIGMVGMSASMANGVQGIAVGLLDYTISQVNNAPQLDSLDALITISAENPEQLFNTVKMFIPELQQVVLKTDGEVVALSNMLPLPAELNIVPTLAIKGKHLVIYNGEKGEQAANALSSETLTKNGLINFSLDFKQAVSPIVTATELSGESIPEEMMFLTDYDARMLMSFDINPQGLIFKSSINNIAPKKWKRYLNIKSISIKRD